MTRIGAKNIINKPLATQNNVYADFNKQETDGLLVDRGYGVIYEKALLCPCKDEQATHQMICKNCGGIGWIFANPTRTRMVLTSIQSDGKFSNAMWVDWGMIDSGSVVISALDTDKLSFMDRITISDAIAEHSQILYPKLTDDSTQLFAFTKYNIRSVEYVGLFIDVDTQLQRLEYETDYSWHDNVIVLNDQYNNLENPAITIRYRHNPVFHVIDVLRESMSSTRNSYREGQVRFEMPIKAIGKRAHLIKDAENYNGDRLLNNSWLPLACEDDEVVPFLRQLKYTDAQVIYDNLTSAQLEIIGELISGSDI